MLVKLTNYWHALLRLAGDSSYYRLIREILIKRDPYIVRNSDFIDVKSVLGVDIFEMAVARVAIERKRPFLLQVGANTGKSSHDLYECINKWSIHGVLMEPQKEVFRQLQDNYREIESISLCNAALAQESGSKTLYSLSEDAGRYKRDGGEFGTGIASFNEEHVWSHFYRNATEAGRNEKRDNIIRSIGIDCLSFNGLIDKYNIDKIDIVVIDVEGFDFEVLKMINIEKYKPFAIKYEHKHLEGEKSKSWDYMLSLGYRLVLNDYTGDTIAINKLQVL